MTPSDNPTPSEPSPTAILINASSISSPRRPLVDVPSMTSSLPNLPYRKLNDPVSSLLASTPPSPGSRSNSPNGGLGSLKALTTTPITTVGSSLPGASYSDDSGLRNIIVHAYVPHIAIYTSADTDELAGDKGFRHGLWQLLRPFGEHIQGKVNVRDSNGSSRVYEDFSVRFVRLGDGLEAPTRPIHFQQKLESPESSDLGSGSNGVTQARAPRVSGAVHKLWAGGDIEAVEKVVERHLSYEEIFNTASDMTRKRQLLNDLLSPFYSLYLRSLLSGIPIKPHETFSHPVACIIAISSRNSNPIEALRRLYDESSRGDKRLPVWVNSEYLRYYILVHDEERDDITKSMALFEQMKRHFGLHCHLLRLRSSQCILTDDDSVQLPSSEWISASEELADSSPTDVKDDVDIAALYVFESDVTAIRTFIREMVTQSVVPSMERCMSTWNDQVASRRRGISGRFISITRKWTGIGGTSRTSSAARTSGNPTGTNYDTLQGYYQPDTPEAIMRKLADYAFMLRDWRLAQSTYDLVRADFNSDKAWAYHAAASEMTVVSTLLLPQAISSKLRAESVDQILEAAAYSYLSRCSAPYGTLRSLTLGIELLRIRGGSSVDDAAKWGSRLLETKILGPIGEALMKERIAVCHASRKGVGSRGWGARSRKAALWNILAADDWLNLGKYRQAGRQLIKARRLYDSLTNRESLFLFSAANVFLSGLEREVYLASLQGVENGEEESINGEETYRVDEESETLNVTHRKSLIGATAPQLTYLETAPLQTLATEKDPDCVRDDEFEEVNK